MELQFNRSALPCLDTVLREVRSCEETLEMKLPDALPDVGHIVSAWGQVILRSKEWRGDSILLNGGVMVWVLYAPEDGSQEKCMDGWMPFQLRWDLPQNTPEGDIRMSTLLRSLDARSVSARKIMVRGVVAALAEIFAPMEAELFTPETAEGEVELLKNSYPLRLQKEAGEKTFLLDEELTLPESAPRLQTLIYCRMTPRLLDKKVLSTKAVFRGSGNLHILYRSEEGQLHSWDFDLPFSQFAELRQEHSTDAQIDISTEVSALDLDLDQEGRLRLKGGLIAQYLITDRETVTLTEDAYIPGRLITLQEQIFEIPVQLESRRETVYTEQSLPVQADVCADQVFLPDFPIQRRNGSQLELEVPGVFQVLYYGEDGVLRSAGGRLSGGKALQADENSELTLLPGAGEIQAVAGNGDVTVKAELPLDMTVTARQKLPMVTGVEAGEPLPPDPARPSLILRRAGSGRLWDIAKGNGTTVDAIRKANGLQDAPAPGQILLIPVS